jgi:hypothetical protein
MSVLTSAYPLLVLIAFALTIVSGTTTRLPVWIPLLLVCIALMLGLAR